MYRLICALVMCLSLCGCKERLSVAELEAEASAPHSIEELLKLHDATVAANGRDFFFAEPIGRFGREGVEATLFHMESREQRALSGSDARFFLDVVSQAKILTGYDFCDDKVALQNLEQLPSRIKGNRGSIEHFQSSVVRYCDLRRHFKTTLEDRRLEYDPSTNGENVE